MNAFAAAWMIARKDLRTFFRDKTGVALGFLLPIVLVTVFGFMMKFAFGGGEAMPKATLWVADADGTETSQRFIAALRVSDMLRIRPPVNEKGKTPAEVRELLEDGEAHHALVIEAGFGDALAAGKEPKLTLVRDPGRTMEDRIVRVGLMQGFLTVTEGRLWPASIARTMRKMGMDEAQAQSLSVAAEMMQRVIASFADAKTTSTSSAASTTPTGSGQASAGSQAPPFDVTDFFEDMVPLESQDITPPTRPRMLTYQLAQSVSGVTVMMLLFGMLACGSTLLQERESGTLRRLLIAAVPRGSILGAKFLFSAIIAVSQLVIVFLFGTLVFRIGAFRDPVTLAVLSLTWTAAAASFGMLIAAWAKTTKQAEGIATLLILVMAAVGGCWFPIQILDLPWQAELATQWTPTYWAMSGFQGMFWEQRFFTHPKMLTAIGVQLGFAAVASAAALLLYRRNYVAG
jgi:ABC-2 type transport system permease protein